MNNKISLDDFKKWMKSGDAFQYDENRDVEQIDGMVIPKIKSKRITEQMTTDDDPYEIMLDFNKNGGKVLESDGIQLHIEVESGTFYIDKRLVKIND